MTGRLLLLRHGQTEWARDGRHTGLTDVELTETGEQQALEAGPMVRRLLRGAQPAITLTSPLLRAHRTAELAGLSAEPAAGLVEWDYGGYEGLTAAQIREQAGPDWTVFTHGVVPGPTPGETLVEVAARVRAVLERVRPALRGGDVVVVGHGHALRVLAACWLGAEPTLGAQLLLDPAGIGVLVERYEQPALEHWNLLSPSRTPEWA